MLNLNPFLGLCLVKEKDAREKQTTLFNYLHSEYFYTGKIIVKWTSGEALMYKT